MFYIDIDQPIPGIINMPPRVVQAFSGKTFSELCKLSPTELMKGRKIGPKTILILKERLASFHLHFEMSEEEINLYRNEYVNAMKNRELQIDKDIETIHEWMDLTGFTADKGCPNCRPHIHKKGCRNCVSTFANKIFSMYGNYCERAYSISSV